MQMVRHYFLILTTYSGISMKQLSDNGSQYNLKYLHLKLKLRHFECKIKVSVHC